MKNLLFLLAAVITAPPIGVLAQFFWTPAPNRGFILKRKMADWPRPCRTEQGRVVGVILGPGSAAEQRLGV